jgi:hypothetical protein
MSVQGNLDAKRPPLNQIVCYPRSEKNPIRKQGNEQTLLLGISVYVEEVSSGKDFPACVKKPEAARLDYLVQETTMLLIGEFLSLSLPIFQGKIVVAVNAIHGAAPGCFYNSAQGDPLSDSTLV